PGHHAEALDVEARREGRHHLDGAAREPEGDGPHRRLARPVEERVGHRGQCEAAGEVLDPLREALEQGRVLVAFRTLLVELLPLLEILELGPDGRWDLRRRRFYFHASIPSL